MEIKGTRMSHYYSKVLLWLLAADGGSVFFRAGSIEEPLLL